MIISIFIFIAASVLLIIAGIEFSNDSNGGAVISILISFILIAIAGLVISIEADKQGQIDAINGKLRYHLVEKHDKTKEWEPIK